MNLEDKCKALIIVLGLGFEHSRYRVTPLTGGVSSDIARIEVDSKVYCAKFALSTLKVAEIWHAPVHRNEAEYHWLKVAADIAPEAALKLYGRSDDLHGFVMEFLKGEDTYLWKTALLEQSSDWLEAAKVGDLLGRIHADSARKDFDRSQFKHRDDFHALRIEPYLLFTAKQHPDLLKPLQQLANQLYDAETVLVHGDVSPKNILFRNGEPVILDAECATVGDGAFDLAFCLNHLVIKSFHLPESSEQLFNSVDRFWKAYSQHVKWENTEELNRRVSHLLPALMLARIDGKSPVEYLSESNRELIRDCAIQHIRHPVNTLDKLISQLKSYQR